MKKLPSLLLCLSALFLSSCVGVAAGAGATAGVAAMSEGGIGGTASDIAIQAQINDLWFRQDVGMFRKLDLTVNQGRVLITGVVQNPEHRVEAVRLAWQPKGVKQVINEIRVADSAGLVGYARDTWITTRLRTALTFDRDVLSINYNIDTVDGTVYLLGVAQHQAELNQVIETARTIPDVKRVVSYVKLRGEPIGGPAPVTQDYNSSTYNNAPPSASYPDSGYQDDTSSYYGNTAPPPLSDGATSGPVSLQPVQAEPLQ